MVKGFRKVLAVASVMMLPASAVTASNSLIVTDKDGQTTIFLLENKPVISFNDEDVILSTEKTTVYYSAKDFLSFSFEHEQVSGIGLVETPSGVTFAFDGGLQCSGLKGGSQVEVYNADGSLVSAGKTAADGSLDLRFNTQRGNIYVVKTSTRTFKIVGGSH